MKKLLSAALSLCLIGAAVPAPARANDGWDNSKIKHVLLISVDGMHALDVANYVHNHPGSAFAELADHGITYSNARTPSNSDSFPGLLALVTGGSPVSHGLFYDASYDRSVFLPGSNCTEAPGATMTFDESIDLYVTVDGSPVSQNVIDPTQLPKYIDENGHCSVLYPHKALRTNTIFEVVRNDHHRWTAWADKHPAYDLVNGPSGSGVGDLYTPEVTNNNGFDNTVSVVCTANNDELKVLAILNEIQGKSHDGKSGHGVPAVFGMNFQAVSVGQKLSIDNKKGLCKADTDPTINGQPSGYLDGAGTPTTVLSYGLKFVDNSLWQMIKGLKAAGIYDSTLFILTAKHGQSPINPAKVNKPGHFTDILDQTNPTAQILINTTTCTVSPCGFVQDDDIALIWLPDQSKTNEVADYLNKNAVSLFIDEVMSGNELKLKFNNPLKDSRVPDIIVQPVYGTIYTASTAKNAEHGGFSFGDTNVGLIVSNPSFSHRIVKTPVTTAQVAPTILQSLGIDPGELKSVQKEGTPVLPFLFDTDNDE